MTTFLPLTCLNRYKDWVSLCRIINVKSWPLSQEIKSRVFRPFLKMSLDNGNKIEIDYVFVYISGGSWRTVFSDFAFYFLSFWISDLSRNLTPAGTLLPTILGYLLHHNSCHVPTPGHFLALQFKQCLMGYKVNCFNEFIR